MQIFDKNPGALLSLSKIEFEQTIQVLEEIDSILIDIRDTFELVKKSKLDNDSKRNLMTREQAKLTSIKNVIISREKLKDKYVQRIYQNDYVVDKEFVQLKNLVEEKIEFWRSLVELEIGKCENFISKIKAINIL